MESPIRKMQKRNDYNRHKLFRKIKRRRRARAEQQSKAAEKELKRRLKWTAPKLHDGKDPSPYITGPDRDYDNFRAYELGYTRGENGHLPSRDYQTGRILKSPVHPTFLKALLEDVRIGYLPYNRNGVTYTNTWRGNEEYNPELNPDRYRPHNRNKKK